MIVLELPAESIIVISNAVRTPLMSNSSGFCHVISMEVDERLVAVTLAGGPLGAM